MKKELQAREHKLAGYVCHGLKGHMLAMTTSPVKNQNMHIRNGEDNVGVRYHTNRALVQIVTCIQRNVCDRKARAYDELSRNVFSLTLGQALILYARARLWWIDFIRNGMC